MDPGRPDARDVRRIADALDGGHIVALPTDTLYGLSADALGVDAVASLRRLKGYRSARPFVVLFDGSRKWLDRLVLGESARVRELAVACWPGPVTLVVRAAPHAPSHLVSGAGGIALRAPRHELLHAVIAALGRPVVSTSANVAGEAPLVGPDQITAAFGDVLAMVVDGGAPTEAVASTLVDATGDRPVVVRRGAGSFDPADFEHDH